LLRHLRSINTQNYPGTKVTPPGALRLLLDNPDRPNVIGEAYTDGHRREMRVKYKVRSVLSQTSTSRSCDYNIIPVYKETTAPINNYVQIALRIDDDTIRQYCEDASNTVALPGSNPPTTLMAEHLDSILHALNGPIQRMDTVLLTSMVANFGVNVATGNNAAQTINISKDLQIQDLNDGILKILADFQDNEMIGTPQVVGSGLFNKWAMLQPFKQMDFSGINSPAQLQMFQWYNDAKSSTIMGADQIGVVAPGTFHLLENLRNVGSFAGTKGGSTFATMTDPYTGLRWDIQFKYYDCPTTVTNAYSGATSTIDMGWVLIISKYYDLFVTPASAFDGADVLAGVNGAFRYTISNACETC